MVVYGDRRGDVGFDLKIAAEIGAAHVEALPNWRLYPDPATLRSRLVEFGLTLHRAHACWGGQAIQADRVDLGDPDPDVALASLGDLKRCVDWLAAAEGTFLVVHPGGISDPAQFSIRREALSRGLLALAVHAQGTRVRVCVENMPPGVYPGSRMADLAALLAELDRPELALAFDTGHAHLGPSVDSENPRRRPVPADHARPRQPRQAGHPPSPRPRHDRVGKLGRNAR